MKRILILFAHPALEKSRVNRKLIENIDENQAITFHDLYQHYPEFDIDVAAEQRLLVQHDIIIFQHPFFWYSTPAIIKEWQDLVLEHGWAYGHDGNQLAGKYLMNILTTGGKKEAYCDRGYNHYTIREFLAPLERTAILCKMEYLPPYVVHGTHSIKAEQLAGHRLEIQQILGKLAADELDIEKIKPRGYMNGVLTP